MRKMATKMLLSLVGLFIVGLSLNGTTEAASSLEEIVVANRRLDQITIRLLGQEIEILQRIQARDGAGRRIQLSLMGNEPLRISQQIASIQEKIRAITTLILIYELDFQRDLEVIRRGQFSESELRCDIHSSALKTRDNAPRIWDDISNEIARLLESELGDASASTAFREEMRAIKQAELDAFDRVFHG